MHAVGNQKIETGGMGKGTREMIRFKQKLTEKNKITERVCKGGWRALRWGTKFR